MRLLDQGPDALTDGASVWVSRFEMRRGDSFGVHRHRFHQLCWSPVGLLRIDVDGRRWSLPPSLAMWIPSDAPHDVACVRGAHLHNLYVVPEASPVPWAEPTVVAVGALVREVVLHLVTGGTVGEPRARAEQFLFDILRPIRCGPSELRLPMDARAAAVAEGLLRQPADPRTLDEWGREVGASGRTLARQFLAETGVSFGEWRTHARVHAAIGLLASGTAVSAVPPLVGYRDPDAFAAMFRRHVGSSPVTYVRAP